MEPPTPEPPTTPPARAWVGWVVLAIVAGTLVHLPALSAGFHMDDLAQWAMLTGRYPVERSSLDLFDFVSDGEVTPLVAAGSLPWWSDPDLRLSAFRPLSSALTALDHRLFGSTPLLHHLHSWVWWVATIASAAWLLAQIVPRRWAILAIFFFALDEGHGFPLAWLANRNALVSATFGFLALGAHLRWREGGDRRWAWGSALALASSLAGGETGLCAFLLVVAHEIAGRRDAPIQRVRAAMPAVLVVLVHAVVHRLGGYGVAASGAYFDPLGEPLAWLEHAPWRWLVLVGDMVLAVPSGRAGLNPDRLILFAPLGLLGMSLMGLAALRLREQPGARTLRWAWLGSVAAILPTASAFVSARLLVIPTLLAHAVIAGAVVSAVEELRRRPVGPGVWLHRVLAGAWVLLHGLLAPYWAHLETRNIAAYDRDAQAVAASMQDPASPDRRLVLLTATDPWTLLYPPTTRAMQGHPMPASWWVLSMAPYRHRLTRVDDRTLELAVEGGAMLQTPVERLFRRAPMRAGERVTVPSLTVEVLEVDDRGGPIRVRYHFDRHLDDPSLVVLFSSPHGIVRYPLGPTASTVVVAPGTPPSGIVRPATP